MSPRLTSRFVAAFAAALLLSACHRDDNNGVARHDDRGWGDAPDSAEVAQAAASAPETPLGPGDVRIFTTDSSVEMALLGDRVSTRLGPKVLAEVDKGMAKDSSEKQSGLGAMIAGAVKSGVRSAISRDYGFPLTAIRDARYENGAIVFDWVDKPTINPDNANVNGRKLTHAFAPADAQRFVDAVRARLHHS